MTYLVAAEGGVGVAGLIGIAVPLATAIVAIVLLGPQRAKLVGESLGDAVEDLRAELEAVRADRNTFRDERDQLRVDLMVTREELRLLRLRARTAGLEVPDPNGGAAS